MAFWTPNMGEKRFTVTTHEGPSRGITTQVCDVDNPPLSVRKVVAGGNRVVFDVAGSYIEDKVIWGADAVPGNKACMS